MSVVIDGDQAFSRQIARDRLAAGGPALVRRDGRVHDEIAAWVVGLETSQVPVSDCQLFDPLEVPLVQVLEEGLMRGGRSVLEVSGVRFRTRAVTAVEPTAVSASRRMLLTVPAAPGPSSTPVGEWFVRCHVVEWPSWG